MQKYWKMFGLVMLVSFGMAVHVNILNQSARANESVTVPQVAVVAEVVSVDPDINVSGSAAVVPLSAPSSLGRTFASVAKTVRQAAPVVVPEAPVFETTVAAVAAEEPSVLKSELDSNKKSGISGRMFIDGGCPVMKVHVDNPEPDPNCVPRPYRGTVTIIRTDVPEYIGQVTSNAHGHFTIDLVPGTYYLRDNADNIMQPMISVIPVTVIVAAGEYADVHIMFDSGIR